MAITHCTSVKTENQNAALTNNVLRIDNRDEGVCWCIHLIVKVQLINTDKHT